MLDSNCQGELYALLGASLNVFGSASVAIVVSEVRLPIVLSQTTLRFDAFRCLAKVVPAHVQFILAEWVSSRRTRLLTNFGQSQSAYRPCSSYPYIENHSDGCVFRKEAM